MGLKLAGIMVIIMSVMAGIGYWYYKDTQEIIRILNENNASLEAAVDINEATIADLQDSYTAIQLENERINQEYTEIRRQNSYLADRLADHDLGVLAAERPELIERAINRGSANAARCFEILSGASLTEQERNAENGEAFNQECPWLWPGSSAGGLPR